MIGENLYTSWNTPFSHVERLEYYFSSSIALVPFLVSVIP